MINSKGIRNFQRPTLDGSPLDGAVSISVVICCYTQARRQILAEGADAALAQLSDDDDVILVVDGNDLLFHDMTAAYGDRLTVVQNGFRRGLSGARNTGLDAASGDVVVFLDDDAVLQAGGLDGVRRAFIDSAVCALGGAVHPAWESGSAPRWFPPEFGWVVGCDYRGLPPNGSAIRNPIGAAMAVRRAELADIGGFSDRLGRVGTLPTGCEETLMGIELTQRDPHTRIIRETAFAVSHAVPEDRMTVSYFLRRCFYEGRSKAIVTRLCGRTSSLASERAYTTRTLPLGIWHARRQPSRILALALGLLVTGAGYVGGLALSLQQREAGQS